ncbi:ribonuclease III [Bacillota bacterium]
MNEANLESKIGYTFKNPALLTEALTHSSAANENTCAHKPCNRMKSNERLEFLGDAVLDLAVSKYLYDRLSDLEEGQLSKIRALIVCERSLAECAKLLNLDKAIALGRGEDNNGGRLRPSILSDAVEALIGAVYIDGGFDIVASLAVTVLEDTIEKALAGLLFHDYKTEIQEKLQAQGMPEIKYLIDREDGPDHDKTFFVSLWDGAEKLGEGAGKTKKQAEQNAAKSALEG